LNTHWQSETTLQFVILINTFAVLPMRLLWVVLTLAVCATALASAVEMSEDLEAEVVRTSQVQSGRSRTSPSFLIRKCAGSMKVHAFPGQNHRAKVTPGQIFMNGATVFLRTSRRGHYLSVGAFGELFGMFQFFCDSLCTV
jgi:hypothetical protein